MVVQTTTCFDRNEPDLLQATKIGTELSTVQVKIKIRIGQTLVALRWLRLFYQSNITSARQSLRVIQKRQTWQKPRVTPTGTLSHHTLLAHSVPNSTELR